VTTEFGFLPIDSFQEQAESPCIYLDAVAVVVDVRQALKRTALEPLVVQPEASVLKHQELDLVAALVEEDKQVAAEGVVIELCPDDSCEAIELLPEVCRPTGDEDA